MVGLMKSLAAKAALVAGAAALVLFLLWRNETLSHQRDVALSQVAELQLVMEFQQQSYADALEQIEALALQNAVRATSSRKIREEAVGAPTDDDGTVAPVLRRVLDRLRERAGEAGAGTPGDT